MQHAVEIIMVVLMTIAYKLRMLNSIFFIIDHRIVITD